MKRERNADGTLPLTFDEYQGLRALFGMVGLTDTVTNKLQERLKMTPGAWRDVRLIQTLFEKIMPALMSTIPTKKLLGMRAELKNTEVEVRMKAATFRGDESILVAVPQGALEHVINEATGFKCFGCTVQKFWECGLYRAVDALYHYDFPKGSVCPFSDMAGIEQVLEGLRNKNKEETHE